MSLAPAEAVWIHSVKVPRLYKVAAFILEQYRRGEGSVKNLVYEGKKKRHPNISALLALVMECVNHSVEIDVILDRTRILADQPRLQRHLAEILVTELLWGKGSLSGESRPVLTVLDYEESLRLELQRGGGGGKRTPKVRFPRYARVNTLKNNLRRVIKQLKSEEFVEIIYERSTISYSTFISLIKALRPEEFLLDLHVENLIIFAPGTKLHDHPLYLDGSLQLQDKSSCFPVQALNVPAGSVVLDACAAPGMKTSQLAAAVRGTNKAVAIGDIGGRVLAVERDVKRCETLRKMIENSTADSMTEVLNQDFLDIDPQDHGDVKYILVDPSCSGSGMVQREGEADMSFSRLERLAGLQAKLLKHALSFPNVKRVVYSTCSISEEENEKVVESVLSAVKGFKIVHCLQEWERRGKSGYNRSDRFIRASAEEDLCNGFFVAVLQKRKGCKKAKIAE